jgi:NADH-quinone oxidoreductase subunit N
MEHMVEVNYLELARLLGPEIILVLTVLVTLVLDLGVMRGEPLRYRSYLLISVGILGCLAAVYWMGNISEDARFMEGVLVVDSLTQTTKQLLLGLTIVALLFSMESEFTTHVSEYVALMLLATLGMMLMISSEELLMIFLSLELTSLSLYVLAGFRKQSPYSAEAALKYFLFGGMAAAFTLFGLSLLYGMSGTTSLHGIAAALVGQRLDPLMAAALVLVLVGLGFKIAVVPFHLWAPDVYQGAPSPSAVLIASGSKLASFFLLAKVMIIGFAGFEGSVRWGGWVAGWAPLLVFVAVASMLLGNLAAIVQQNVKRLLAFSAVAHGGYALLAVLAGDTLGISSLVYYMATYGLTVAGAFGVIALLESNGGTGNLRDFAGLAQRSPLAAFCMLVFMLSLAGIPPLAGFFGKFYVFTAAIAADPLRLGFLWLVLFALIMSAVSLYYYLQVLKQIFVVETPETGTKLEAGIISQVTLGAAAAGVIALGVSPNWLITHLALAAQRAGF